MQQFRRSFLSILLLVAVVTAVVGSTGLAYAAPRYTLSEPFIPPSSPPPTDRDPNTGEPDSGSTRSQQTHPSLRSRALGDPQFAVRTVRAVSWTSLVWIKRLIGVGN